MATKKNLYQLLDIPMSASEAAVERAYQLKLQLVEDSRASLTQPEYDFRLKVLSVAKQTLLDPMSRHQYDHKLMAEQQQQAGKPAGRDPVLNPFSTQSQSSALALQAADYEQRASQADALSLRADAMHMRADAIAILAAAGAGTAPQSSWTQDLLGGAWAPVKRVLIVLGIMGLLWSVLQFSLAFRSSNQAARMLKEERRMSRAEEQAILQQHFQIYGERPASVEEARMLAAAHQKRAQEQQEASRQKERMDDAEKKFIEESQRRNEQVSRQLRDEEESARYREMQDKERDSDRLEMERRQVEMRERQERLRQEQQQREWQQILRR
jgi:hypothetical protein